MIRPINHNHKVLIMPCGYNRNLLSWSSKRVDNTKRLVYEDTNRIPITPLFKIFKRPLIRLQNIYIAAPTPLVPTSISLQTVQMYTTIHSKY